MGVWGSQAADGVSELTLEEHDAMFYQRASHSLGCVRAGSLPIPALDLLPGSFSGRQLLSSPRLDWGQGLY